MALLNVRVSVTAGGESGRVAAHLGRREVGVPRHLDVPADRVHEPQRAVGRVVLGAPGVGGVGDDDVARRVARRVHHDETPLGPRDEDDATGENSFFDQEADTAGFRDVFRRRR